MRAPLPRSCVVCAARTNGASRCPAHTPQRGHGDAEYQRNRALARARDRFRCVICGNGPHNGHQLEVDHITPIRDGGTHELANLRTLCIPHHHQSTQEGRP